MSLFSTEKDEIRWLMANTQLGGSRYFALNYPDIIQINKDTDWDFYAQDSDKIFDTLMGRGYYSKFNTNSIYVGDDLLSNIMVNDKFPSIQVLLRTDAKLYTKVVESLAPEFYRDYLWKSGPNYCARGQIQSIFNQLFKTVRND